MNSATTSQIAVELGLRPAQVETTAALLAEGATVPFIARYRKERTGELDEVAIGAIRDRLQQLAELEARRATILESLRERELLSDELAAKIESAKTLSVLEDLYLPFRPKRRTRAMVARERGLEPLAQRLFEQQETLEAVTAAEAFVDPEREVPDAGAALAGARDIIAEWVNEDAEARAEIRALYDSEAVLVARVVSGKEDQGAKFRDYFEAAEPVRSAAGHRILAMFRGEKEGVLSVTARPDRAEAEARLQRRFVRNAASSFGREVAVAVDDAYARLMAPSMEIELRLRLKQRAGEEAIAVFASNLRELLMASALGQKAVLAIDPGIRTGCKVACLDPQGKLVFDTTIQIARSDYERREAAGVLVALCGKFAIEAIAIGNGTYGRETEAFVRSLDLPAGVVVTQVNESGASVYSASEVAREEFPDRDLTVRGSVSIGRRLMDPLAELVKVDPKSIGVGQYQHDVDPGQLRKGLDEVVVSCVNAVGVEVNTASRQLLAYVSGLGPSLADHIVQHRDSKGPFATRSELLKVPRLGPKAFEQCAGFLRVRGSSHPLDASAVHPERYALVERMAADLGCGVADLMGDATLRGKVRLERYVDETVGLPTLRDILAELAKPGRDPRSEFEAFQFAEGVATPEDLQPGMKLPGIVTNVTRFGAFVDVGVHQDGLVHISALSDRFVADPADVVKVGQKVLVTVLEVDLARRRIALSMKSAPAAERRPADGEPSRGDRHRPTAGEPGRGGRRPETRARDRRPGAGRPPAAGGGGLGNLFADAFSSLEKDSGKRR